MYGMEWMAILAVLVKYWERINAFDVAVGWKWFAQHRSGIYFISVSFIIYFHFVQLMNIPEGYSPLG